MRIELRRGHVAWLTAALLVLMTIGVFCFVTIVNFSDTSASRQRTQALFSRMGGTASAMSDVEIAQRRYKNADDPVALATVREKLKYVAAKVQDLKEVIGEDAADFANIAELHKTIDVPLHSDNPDDVLQMDYVEKFLLQLRKMRTIEEESFKVSTATSDRNFGISILAMCFGIVFAFFLIIYTAYLLNRELLERNKIEEELLTRERLHAGIIATQHAIGTSDLHLDKVMDMIVVRVMLLTNADGAAIETLEEDMLIYRAVSGMANSFKGLKIPFEGSFSAQCAESGTILYSNDCQNDPRVNQAIAIKYVTKSLMVMPLFVEGTINGFLKISSKKVNAFTQRHVEALQIIGGLVSSSMERAVSFASKQEAERAALESARLKSEFLAHMSHEIRTPANGVVGMLSLLSDTPLDHSQKEYLDIIHRSMDALLTIMNDILDFSKIEAGKMELECAEFDLEQSISDIEKSMTVTAREKGLAFNVRRPEPFLCAFQGDPGRLRQVLLNFLSNAIKFTQHGHVTLGWELVNDNDDSSQIRFTVEDTGIGMSEDVMARIFDSFAQGDASTSRRFGGTGLGLCISKRLVNMMGGTIECRSEVGKGTEFSFVVHLKKGAQKPAINGYKFPEVLASVVTDKRILVAEDNFVNQKVAMGILERLGCKAVTVGNGKEAVEILKTVPFDLVLMDCQMPELDGYAATALIRGNKESTISTLPVIAMTASAIKGDRERCLAAGMNDYLSKPVRPNELAAMLEKWLS